MLVGYFLSLAAASHALTTPTSKDSAHLTQRNEAASCGGGRFFSGWFDEAKGILPGCKCPNGLVWDDDQEQCLFPALPKPKAGPGEKVICAQTADKYISYDPAAETCSYDGHNVVLLVSRRLSETQVKQAITKECKKPKCPSKKTWNGKLGKCEYPKLPKEDADKCTKKGGKPVCAKKPSEHCPYNKDDVKCEDDGENCLKCLNVDTGGAVEKLLRGTFATAKDALDALGLKCILTGLDCATNDGVWDKLGGGLGGLGDVVCNVLGQLLGLC